MLDPALEDLRKRYREGDMVLFVGAGVSAAAGLPSWSKLVEALLVRARARGASAGQVGEVEQLLAERRYVDALTAAAAAAGPNEMVAVVKSALDDRSRVPEVPAIGKAIAALGPRLRAVLTTNLDHLLERAFAGDWPALHRAPGDIAQDRGIILKLHGTLLDPETWVLTRDQYDRAMYNDPRLDAAVAAFFQARTLLFVGYGLADDDFDKLLAQVRARAGAGAPRHYALVPAAQVTPHWREVREKAGVRIITYATHDEVPSILRWIAADDVPAPPSSAPVSMFAAAPPPPSSGPGLPPPAPPGPDAPYDRRYYVHRPVEEQRALEKLEHAGTPVVLWGPRRIGKTTLMRHLVDRLREAEGGDAGMVVEVDLGVLSREVPEQASEAEKLDRLLDRLATEIVDGMRRRGDAGWLDEIAQQTRKPWALRLRHLLERRILPNAGRRFVLVLENADALRGHPSLQGSLYVILRSFCAIALEEHWAALRLVLLVSTTPALVFDADTPDSPFGNLVADPIELDDLSADEVVMTESLGWTHRDVGGLFPLVGGHPYLLRLITHRARVKGVAPETLARSAEALEELTERHLDELGSLLDHDPKSKSALLGILGLGPKVPLDVQSYHRLRRAGVVTRDDKGELKIRYALYASYLRRRWQAT